jgi:hypothetical protein
MGHASLAAHLRSSNGVHCLRCTGPSLERRLLWNDTTQQQQETMLDEMQAQWLARVAEGCAHSRVGLTLRGAFRGGLSTCMLLHVMGYVFGGTQVHLQSCISTGRVTQAVAAVDVHGTVVPKLALVSHALALAATPKSQPIPRAGPSMLGGEVRQQLQTALRHAATRSCEWLHGEVRQPIPVRHIVRQHIPRARPPVLGDEARQQLQTALRQGSSSCEWLHAYCDFLQRRYSLGQR